MTNLLENLENKMTAIYKYNHADKSPTSLLKGLIFNADTLAYDINGSTIRLYDKENNNGEEFIINTDTISSVDFKPKADKYGAFSARLSIASDDYLLKFAQ